MHLEEGQPLAVRCRTELGQRSRLMRLSHPVGLCVEQAVLGGAGFGGAPPLGHCDDAELHVHAGTRGESTAEEVLHTGPVVRTRDDGYFSERQGFALLLLGLCAQYVLMRHDRLIHGGESGQTFFEQRGLGQCALEQRVRDQSPVGPSEERTGPTGDTEMQRLVETATRQNSHHFVVGSRGRGQLDRGLQARTHVDMQPAEAVVGPAALHH